MEPFVRSSIQLVTIIFAAIWMVGCDRGNERASTATTDGLTPVTLQLNWLPEPQFGGMYQAQLDGIFKDEGLDVTIQSGSAGVSTPQLADTGAVEFSIVAAPQVLQLNDRGGSLVALFAAYQHDPHAIMVLADSRFKSLRELWVDPNVTIGCESNLAYIRMIERKYGSSGTAKLVAYNPPAFRAGVQQGSQCFMTAEPISLELEGVKTRVFLANETGFDPYTTVLVTRHAYLESNRSTCESMVRAFARGWQAYLDSPEKANREMGRLNPGMSSQAMALSAQKQVQLIKDDETERFGLGCMSKKRWQVLADQLLSLDMIDAAPDVEKVFEWKPPAATGVASGSR